jgi:hypothetical protein
MGGYSFMLIDQKGGEMLYKLTNRDGTTYNGCKWGNNVTHELPKKKNPELCSGDVIHIYKNKNLAYLLNPIHADFSNPVVWKAEAKIEAEDWEKSGGFKVTTIKKLSKPWWVNGEKEKLVRVAFAVLCAEAVLQNFEKVCPGDKQPRQAIEAAREYLTNPTDSAADSAASAARAAYSAADSASRAAYGAAYSAGRAAYSAADSAASAADSAAESAVDSAASAAYSAARAADSDEKLDFGKLADRAVRLIRNR